MPWPLDDGGRIGLWQSVWGLARTFDTTLVTLVPPEDVVGPPPPALEALGVRVIRVPHRHPWAPIALVRGSFGRWPYTLTRYRNAEFDRTLRQVVLEGKPAFAFVNHLHLATYRDALGGVPIVLREHNLEHLWLARYAECLTNPFARAYAVDQARRMRKTEGEICSQCDLVLAIHEAEADVLRRLAPTGRIEVVPVGIDFGAYLSRAPAQPPSVLVVGSWDWPPNADGLLHFLERGWGRVSARYPDVALRVVGKHLHNRLAVAARRAGAEPVGYVDSMALEFARAAVMVVPVWVGAGARVKIVEALAARVPVVTTTLGAEGLGLEPEVHALVADTPESLGDAVAELLNQPERATALASAGYDFARSRYSLDQVACRTNELCATVLHRGTAAPPSSLARGGV